MLGTRIVMQTGLYGALNELEVLAPPGAELAQVNDDYVAMAVAGVRPTSNGLACWPQENA